MKAEAGEAATGTPQLRPAADIAREVRRVRRLLVATLLLGLVITCFFAKDVLLPIILGTMLALTLSPVVRGAGRIGIPAPLTAAGLIVSLATALAFGGYAMSGPVSNWIAEAPEMGDVLRQKLEGIFRSVEKVREASEEVGEIAEQTGGGVQKVAIQQPGILSSAVSNAASIGTTVAVALVLALFLLASGEMFYVKLVETFPKMSEKKRALRIVYGVEKAISRYLLTITAINAGLGIVIGTLMTLIGLPNGYIWGFVAFILNFLPFLGAVAGTLLVGAYAILSFDQLSQAALAPALYLTATAVEGQIVTPTILGRRLEMNTVSVFITVVFWGWMWGIAGALMAVPFLVIVKVICDNVEGWQTLGNFLGSSRIEVDTGPAEEPEGKAAATP
ncbi:hypothetical protein OCGS_1762 [Oceaniovalibus guishaninsula JLT2003]|uniref:AI-2E family transporter n=1 Tax=Oceaniovalibus guishaninsula JLT2003 TaxID=1231392 RepID=K2GNM3_9RHOB|nr:AI-2E family transporter [Oceaniovalibus guishaninsula]EKE44246.1 hypothetical protein OCGS_1762 [Oceaniovalibus guishaninsula JLT2003]